MSQQNIDAAIPRSRRFLCLGAILLYALSVRLALIDRPFHRNSEGVASFFGILGRNYFRYDWRTTLGVPVQSLTRSPTPPVYYANHPPLVPLLIAATYGLFGYRGSFEVLPPDWQLRLPTVLFTLGCIVAIYRLTAARAGPRAALIAAALFAGCRMTVYYGAHADVINPQLVFFVLLTVAAYERFHDAPGPKTLAILSLAFIPAGLTDWVAYFLLPVLSLHYACTKPPRAWGWFAAFGFFGTGLFALAYLQLNTAWHDPLWMRVLFVRRSVTTENDRHIKFNSWTWFNVAVLGWSVWAYSWPLILLALGWIFTRGWRLGDVANGGRFVRLLLAWGILHVLVGRQGVFNHPWWWWPMAPGIIIAAGIFVDRIASRLDVADGHRTTLRRPLVNGTIVLLIAIFAGVNTWRVVRILTDPHAYNAGEQAYSIVESGAAIRAAAPPGEAVILVDNDPTVSLWYYADRPIIQRIWDIDTIRSRIADPRYTDLPFEFVDQPWTRPPMGLVLPRVYQPYFQKLIADLQANYRQMQVDPAIDAKFMVFDLRSR